MASVTPKATTVWEDRSHARWLVRSAWQNEARAQGLLVSCLNCEQFDQKAEVCRLANVRPPAAVLIVGCPSWSEDIPF